MYAIKKNSLYVRDMQKGGGTSSYTSHPELAKTYQTIEEAKKNCCGNEHIVFLVLGYERVVNTKGKED